MATEKLKGKNLPDFSFFAEVAVSLPIEKTFTYTIPIKWKNSIQIGQRVLIPFGKRKLTGHIISLKGEEKTHTTKLKELLDLLDPEPIFTSSMLSFLEWVSSYYHCPLGEVLRTATPSGINLKSIRQVTLTPQGENAFDPLMVDVPEDHVLQYLVENGPCPIRSLLRLDGVRESLLHRLEKKGWITIDTYLEKVRIKPLKERIVCLVDHPEGESLLLRGKKQKVVLDFLKNQEEVSLSDLEIKVRGCRKPVERLVQLGLLSIKEREIYRDPLKDFEKEAKPIHSIQLTPDQEKAFHAISKPLLEKKYQAFLLYGITGSGKTEVYIRAVKKVVDEGRSAILLVPEISLTTQMVNRFHRRFGDQVALIHSGLSDGERYDQWRQILKGKVKIVIGARSAVFAPVPNLGLIVIDEEHDHSFKQDSGLFYHARDLAIMRARVENAVVISGSATPSIETYFKTQENPDVTKGLHKKFTLLNLPERIGARGLPEVEIIDMTKSPLVYRKKTESHDQEQKIPLFSKKLLDGIRDCFSRKEQSILFLNRRGYAPFLMCTQCGKTLECPHCAISLTFYQNKKVLRCHYCDHSEPLNDECWECKSPSLKQMGFGTEALEEELQFHFPHARLLRLDRDTTVRKDSHRKILKQVKEGDADILIGTQMVAKGHHFPKVTLVGVISADIALHMPDFRASERTFQLLTQVAGRAGRGEQPGKVMVQTYNPDHYGICFAKNHDFLGFYQEEINMRRELDYPPFTRLVSLRLSAKDLNLGEGAVEVLEMRVQHLKNFRENYQKEIRILGPTLAPLARIRGNHRWHLLLKSSNANVLHRFVFQLRKILEKEPKMRGTRLQIDVDPLNLL